MKVEFKIGQKRLYKIKELSEFYDRMMNKTFTNMEINFNLLHTKKLSDRMCRIYLNLF